MPDSSPTKSYIRGQVAIELERRSAARANILSSRVLLGRKSRATAQLPRKIGFCTKISRIDPLININGLLAVHIPGAKVQSKAIQKKDIHLYSIKDTKKTITPLYFTIIIPLIALEPNYETLARLLAS
jgi:hypothetical protein